MDMQAAIRAATEKRDLSMDEMSAVMRTIMSGAATPAQIGGFLIGLRMKGETVDEITAAAKIMRELATSVAVSGPYLVDTCGTGGDGASTFNISTASAFVVAAAGGKVAKHGNRSISSQSGSADVLEAAGVRLDLSAEQVTRCVDEIGVGFMFAPQHHGAMKYAIGPRREMGVRTLFNLLGPLTNPAGTPHQVVGVFSSQWVAPLAEVLGRLGSQHVMVVHADDGMDEISIGSATQVAELKDGKVTTYKVSPEDFAMTRADCAQLTVADAGESLQVIRMVLSGEEGAAHDIVTLNAGAAIYVAGLVDSHAAGVEKAKSVMNNGEANARLDRLIAFSQGL